ncbi:MAG: helix-turn-helix domain-containing protein, partial [Gammaproteobacteria bacterium]
GKAYDGGGHETENEGEGMRDARRVGKAATQPTKEINRQLLATRLKEAREYLELSQDEVSKALDLPRSAMSLIETGQRKVDAIELKKLAEIYQRPTGYFTGEEAVPEPMPKMVQHLARAAAKLTDRDREELMRFAEYLQARRRR